MNTIALNNLSLRKLTLTGGVFLCLFLSLFASKADAAYLNIVGFETGDTSEIKAVAPSAGFAAQGTTVRTGAYAGRANLSATESHASFGTISSTGAHSAMARTATTYYTFYFRIGTLPSIDSRIATVVSSVGSRVVGLNVNNRVHLTVSPPLFLVCHFHPNISIQTHLYVNRHCSFNRHCSTELLLFEDQAVLAREFDRERVRLLLPP